MMATSKKVVIWSDEDLLGVSIEMLLTAKTNWEVFRIANKEDLDALVMGTRQPDTILIHQGSHNFSPELLQQVLQEYPDIKVIMIGLETNLMDIYSMQKVLAKDPQDLIRVIESEPYPHPV